MCDSESIRRLRKLGEDPDFRGDERFRELYSVLESASQRDNQDSDGWNKVVWSFGMFGEAVGHLWVDLEKRSSAASRELLREFSAAEGLVDPFDDEDDAEDDWAGYPLKGMLNGVAHHVQIAMGFCQFVPDWSSVVIIPPTPASPDANELAVVEDYLTQRYSELLQTLLGSAYADRFLGDAASACCAFLAAENFIDNTPAEKINAVSFWPTYVALYVSCARLFATAIEGHAALDAMEGES